MEYKLKKFVKFWPSINKWVVAYTVPEFDFISDNSFHKNLEVADRRALENIKRRIKFQVEFRALGKETEATVTV